MAAPDNPPDSLFSDYQSANLSYQNGLLTLMRRLQKAMDRTADLEVLINDLVEDISTPGNLSLVSQGTQCPSLPWLKHLYGRNMVPNSDGEARDRFISTTSSDPWTPKERERLKTEVRNANLQLLAQQSLESDTPPTQEFLKKLKKDARLDTNIDGLDWDVIANNCSFTHTADDCRIRWTQKDHPAISNKAWSKDESERLAEIATKYDCRKWDLIAEELGTSRTAAACLKQYRNRSVNKQAWSKDEDEKLRQAIKLYGENWQSIARHVGRHSNQCLTRWTKSLNPDIKKGKWSKDEDQVLKEAIEAVGQIWKLVAPRVKGRTDAQCRERWVNVLDPRIKKGAYTKEEDQLLLRCRDEKGMSWMDICKEMGFTRTDNSLLRRYKELGKSKGTSAKGKGSSRKRKEREDEHSVSGDEES